MVPQPEQTLTTRGAAARGGAPTALSHAERLQGLGVLAGGMAHDFNNLLVGILGHADLALAELPEGSAARESVEEIARTALVLPASRGTSSPTPSREAPPRQPKRESGGPQPGGEGDMQPCGPSLAAGMVLALWPKTCHAFVETPPRSLR